MLTSEHMKILIEKMGGNANNLPDNLLSTYLERLCECAGGSAVNPIEKTEAMTQSVGMDDDGRLWTEPGTSGGGVTTLHINVTAVDDDTQKATFTADKTPVEMQQAATTGPIWCIVTFAAGIVNVDNPVSVGIPPAWNSFMPAFGYVVPALHDADGANNFVYAVRGGTDSTWLINLEAFGS